MITQKHASEYSLLGFYAFQDGRVHFHYSDSSSLILHRGNVCCTYFMKNGDKRRFLIQNIPAIECVKEKLITSLRKINEYNDVPILKIEDLYPPIEYSYKNQKLNSCIWSLESKNYLINNDQSIQVQSEDGHATLLLDPKGFIFKIKYLQLIPQKKPIYDCAPSTLEENNSFNAISEQQQYNFKKDFLEKYNISTFASTEEKKRQKVKLCYAYVTINKTYSIFAFPKRWTLPLYLAWSIFLQLSQDQQKQPLFEPQFDQQILELCVNQLSVSHSLIQSDVNESIIDEPFNYNNELTDLNQETRKISKNEIMVELPNISLSQFLNSQEALNTHNMWNNDDTVPCFGKPKYNELVELGWRDNVAIWFIMDQQQSSSKLSEMAAFNQLDKSFIVSTQNEKFFHQYAQNFQENNNERVFTDPSHVPSDSLLLQYCDIKSNLKAFHDILQCNQILIDMNYNEKRNETEEMAQQQQLIQSDNLENINLYSDNYEVHQQMQNEHGNFIAFKNHSIKAHFHDRTVVYIQNKRNHCRVISKFGEICNVLIDDPKEFGYYVELAYNFFYEAFTCPKEKFIRQTQKQQLQDQIQCELERNQRMINIIHDRVPDEFKENQNNNSIYFSKSQQSQQYGQEIQYQVSNIEDALARNQQILNDIKSLLN